MGAVRGDGPVSNPERSIDRRAAFGLGCGLVSGLALGGALAGIRGRHNEAGADLRPPGALAEQDFLSACVRCGLCVEACPFETLRLTDLDRGFGAGTPTLEPTRMPCYLCQGYDDMKCIGVCPTGALRPTPEREVRMGIAKIDESICLAYNRTVCRSCWHACPFPDEAITLNERLRPVVDESHCVGCGICEYACPTEQKSIFIVPPAPDSSGEGGAA